VAVEKKSGGKVDCAHARSLVYSSTKRFYKQVQETNTVSRMCRVCEYATCSADDRTERV